MTESNQQSGRLTSRDRGIMQHLIQYRITTNEVLHRTQFEHASANVVIKSTSRLCRLGYLKKFPLIHPQCYFTAGDRAVRELGISPHRGLPLGPQALPVDYAVLAYATLGKNLHTRPSPQELANRYPWLPDGLLELPHCLRNESDGETLESIRVDLGGTPDHIARKCDADLQVRVGYPEFYSLIADRRFRAVVLTGTTEKAAVIEQSLGTHLWPEGYTFHLAVVPELIQLIPGGTHGR